MSQREKIRVRKVRKTGGSVVIALDRGWLEERGFRVGEDDCALFYTPSEIIIQPLTETSQPIARTKEGSP